MSPTARQLSSGTAKGESMKAILYARVSTNEQRKEYIDDQLRECRELCRRHGFDAVGEYCDRARSGNEEWIFSSPSRAQWRSRSCVRLRAARTVPSRDWPWTGESRAESAMNISLPPAVARAGEKLTMLKPVKFGGYSHGTPLARVRGGSPIV
jgi:hypothetical protein